MNTFILKAGAGLIAAFVSTASYSTGLLGSTGALAGYCCNSPTEPDRRTEFVSAIIGNSVEFESGTIPIIDSNFFVVDSFIDIADATFKIEFIADSFTLPGQFNGVVVNFSGNLVPEIVGLTINPLTNINLSWVSYFYGPSTIGASIAGATVAPGDRLVLNIEFSNPIPEPGTSGLMMAGILGVWLWTRRGRKLGS